MQTIASRMSDAVTGSTATSIGATTKLSIVVRDASYTINSVQQQNLNKQEQKLGVTT